jgi:hypothetical protein
MPNLRAIANAMLEYPWTRGRLITWAADVPAYCALGAMLRAVPKRSATRTNRPRRIGMT